MTNPCSIPGCDRKAKVKGLCQRCYQRGYDQRKREQRQKEREHTAEVVPTAALDEYERTHPLT